MDITYSAAANPGGKDRDTRGKDVDRCAEVGEGSQAVGAVGGTDGVDSGLRCGREVGSICGRVTSSNGKEDASRNSIGSSRVDSGGAAATKRHVGNGTVGAATGLSIGGNEVDTGNNTGVGTLDIVSSISQQEAMSLHTEPLASRTLTAYSLVFLATP